MKDFEIRCDESRLETTNLIYGKFTLGPFLPGQATTFGNALRRSLLAELSGLAITAFEIIGVMQEFSTLPGLRESILDLSLNLKQIVLTGVLPHSTPPIGFLNVRGPAIIKAVDLKLPAGVCCASPNQYIATLGSNGMLHLKFIVSIGKGYSIQPYSIYRSLSKIRLQPASNFDNTVSFASPLESESLTKYQQLENLSSQSKTFAYPEGFAKERKSIETNKRVDSNLSINSVNKEITVSSPDSNNNVDKVKALQESTTFKNNPSTSSYKYNKNSNTFLSSLDEVTNQKIKKKGLQTLLASRPKEGSEPTSTDKAKSNEEFSYSIEHIGREIPNSQRLNSINNVNKEGFASEGIQRVENLDSSQSTFFTKEKNSSYINIQTQLFQRITPHQVLPIDAVFTPVSQVNFLTEVNDRFETARENIVLEIWTNGSIHPKRALEEATLSLVQNFDTLLKKIQQASSFYKGLRYWTSLQPFKSSLETPQPVSESMDSLCISDPFLLLTPSESVPLDPKVTPTGYSKEVRGGKAKLSSLADLEGKLGYAKFYKDNFLNDKPLNYDSKNLSVPSQQALRSKESKEAKGDKLNVQKKERVSSYSEGVQPITFTLQPASDSIEIKGKPLDSRRLAKLRAFTDHLTSFAQSESFASEGEQSLLASRTQPTMQNKPLLASFRSKASRYNGIDSEGVRSKKGSRMQKQSLYPFRACEAGGKMNAQNYSLVLQQDELEEDNFSTKSVESIEKLFKKDLPQSIYNLDVGNLNLSLQTFIFLKKAKIHTLLQLLTQYPFLLRTVPEGFALKQNTIPYLESLKKDQKIKNNFNSPVTPLAINYVTKKSKSTFLNEKIIEELNNVIKQFGSEE